MVCQDLSRDIEVRIFELGVLDIDEIITDSLLSLRYRGRIISGFPQDLRDHLYQITVQSQDLLLEYRQRHGSLFMCAAGDREVLGKLIGYALIVENSRTSIILEFLSGDLDCNSLRELNPSIKSILVRIQSSWREYTPAFPIELSHRAIATLQMLIAPSPSQALNMLMGKVVAGDISPNDINAVMEKMASADSEGQTGWNDRVRSKFSEWICSASPHDAEKFREVLTGTSIASGLECSVRMANTFSMIHTANAEENLEEQLKLVAKIFKSNAPYRDRIAIHDIIGTVSTEITDSRSNPDVDFDNASKFAGRMAVFFKALGLSDIELSMIALTTIAETYLGHSYEQSYNQPQIGLIVSSRYLHKKFQTDTADFERSIEVGICWGICQAFSEAAKKKALEDDQVKLVYYRFTGNREYLAKFKNTKLLEKTLSTDLGI